MGMPALYITALSAVVLAYADFQDWSALAILGLMLAAGAAIAFAAKKHSLWATASVAATLVVADAISRGLSETPSNLHSSVSFGDLGYAAFVVGAVGWLGGWLMRGRENNEHNIRMIQPEPQPATVPNSLFVSPARSRRRSA
jgi:lysylphosphatidylglycerol synthetase-like protein (DUF2156 family)